MRGLLLCAALHVACGAGGQPSRESRERSRLPATESSNEADEAPQQLTSQDGSSPAVPTPSDSADRELVRDAEGRKILHHQLIVGCWQHASGKDCGLLGVMLFDPVMVAKPEDAARALDRGCELSDATSCSLLAIRLRDGNGIAQNRARSAAFMEKACRLGDEGGCAWAGLAAVEGWLDPPSLQRGVALLTASCNRTGEVSCSMLGDLARRGVLGASRVGSARAFFVRACRLGDEGSCSLLNEAR